MSLCTGMVSRQQNAKNKKGRKEFMKKLFDAAARMNEIEKRKKAVARRLQFLEEKRRKCRKKDRSPTAIL